MWKPNLKGLTDKVKNAGSKTVNFANGLGSKAKNIGKAAIIKSLNIATYFGSIPHTF